MRNITIDIYTKPFDGREAEYHYCFNARVKFADHRVIGVEPTYDANQDPLGLIDYAVSNFLLIYKGKILNANKESYQVFVPRSLVENLEAAKAPVRQELPLAHEPDLELRKKDMVIVQDALKKLADAFKDNGYAPVNPIRFIPQKDSTTTGLARAPLQDNSPVEVPPTAVDYLNRAAAIMEERGRQYDQPGGERSMGKCVLAFNTITGHELTEAEGWLLLQILKDVRQWQRQGFHKDSADDCIAYAALKAEAKQKEAL